MDVPGAFLLQLLLSAPASSRLDRFDRNRLFAFFCLRVSVCVMSSEQTKKLNRFRSALSPQNTHFLSLLFITSAHLASLPVLPTTTATHTAVA